MKIAWILAIGLVSTVLTASVSTVCGASETKSEETFIKTSVATEILKGEARFKDGSFAYAETHTLVSREGRLESLTTEYRGAKPAVVEVRGPADEAQRESSPSSAPVIAKMRHTFLAPGYLPDYQYEDLRNNVTHRLTVDRESKKISLYRKIADEEKSATLDFESGMATGQGVYFWIVANLDTILKREKPSVKFVVPGILDAFPFRAQLVKSDAVKHTIKIELQNWLMNLFLSRLEFDVDAKTNQLLAYRGTSNVADEKGKYRDVVITYETTPKTQASF